MLVDYCKILAVLFFLSLSFECWSESNVTFEKDNLTRQIRENKLRSLLPKSCVFSSRFSQTKTTSLFSLESSGSLFYHCNYGLIWKSEEPFNEILIYKKNLLNFRIEEGVREELTSISHRSLAKFLLRLLNADVDYFLDAFDISYEKPQNDQNLYPKPDLDMKGLRLKPKNSHMQKAISFISLYPLNTRSSVYVNANIESTKSQDKQSPISTPLLGEKNIRLLTQINHSGGETTNIVIDDIESLSSESGDQLDRICTNVIGANNKACNVLKLKKKAQKIK